MKDRRTPAPPQLSSEPGTAAEELGDNDEWTGVVATTDYVGQSVAGLDFADVAVKSGRWSGVTIERFHATDVAFSDCDLAGFVLQDTPRLVRVSFTRCRMSGAVFAGAHLKDVAFVDCALDEANFRMIEAERLSFADCPLTGADFYSAKVAGLTIAASDLRGAIFTKAALTDADLRTSRLEDIVGADSLRGATIGSDQLIPLARSLAVALDLTIVDADD